MGKRVSIIAAWAAVTLVLAVAVSMAAMPGAAFGTSYWSKCPPGSQSPGCE